MKHLYAFMALVTIVISANAQSTYQSVYNILQTNCTGTCHTQGNPNNLVLTGTPQQVYSALLNANPVNTVALAAGNKLVDPGDPKNSFLFNKLNHGLDANLSLQTGEGADMPATTMSQVDREMVRQWILFAAKDTGHFVDSATIAGFYIGQGGFPRQPALTPPAPGTGVQLYWGPMFIPSGVEIQYDINSYLRNVGPIDIPEFESQDNPESHHFAIWKFLAGHDTSFAKGMNQEATLADFATLWNNAPLIAMYPKNMHMQFLQGTGMVWDSATVLSLSFHMINYTDSILAGEAYLNIYYTPHDAATIPVQSAPVIYDYPAVTGLLIPGNNQPDTLVINQHSPDSAFYWNIVGMQAHTHKLGTGFDVWTRNADGTKGDLIYDGNYDPTYTYDQGIYSWNDPPYRKFDTILQVDMTKGLIHQAVYLNPGPNSVGFGLTTQDEMFISFVLYYKSEFPSAIGESIMQDDNLKMYPNPVSDVAFIKITSDADINNGDIRIYDILGNEVKRMNDISSRYFRMDMSDLANGSYIYKLFNNGASFGTGKFIVQR